MKSIKSLAMVCAALAVGFVSGAYLSHPPKVKASTLYKVQRIGGNTIAGSSAFVYDDYVGFSCTAQDCYILTR